MPCYLPLKGYYSRVRAPSGKRQIVFTTREGFVDRPVTVPCGQCMGCRLEYARQWAMRCVHEASMHEENSFITLTYDDEHLPEGGNLVKRDWQLFMKRLRKAHNGQRIRFFHCGEYGTRTGRPHFHGLLFGLGFDDKQRTAIRDGNPVYRSPTLEKVWRAGRSEISNVTFASAYYVAGYVTKKFKGRKEEEAEYYAGRTPCYATMSIRPGLGTEWYEKYKDELIANDSVIIEGHEVKGPRFYDAKLQRDFPDRFPALRGRRKKQIEYDETSDVRLDIKRQVKEGFLGTLPDRGF